MSDYSFCKYSEIDCALFSYGHSSMFLGVQTNICGMEQNETFFCDVALEKAFSETAKAQAVSLKMSFCPVSSV